jgi:SAM-dependent MidA family methyltransferase
VDEQALRRKAQPALLARIDFVENIEALSGQKPAGVFFSNELVDAFPVRTITFRSGQWRERRVGVVGPDLVWTPTAIDDEALAKAIAELPIPAGEGYTTEIHLRARAWMEEVAGALQRGYVLTIDYGYPASLYYAPFRFGGTLTAYEKHQRTEDVLGAPGQRDLTAHVEFTSLARAGEKAGLVTLGFPDQQRFLMGIAHDELSGRVDRPVHLQENIRAWNTLTHPGHLGASFFALVQAKAAPGELDGLRFAGASGLF